MTKRTSQYIENAIIKAYVDGISVKEIEKEFKINYSLMYRVLHRNNIPIARPYRNNVNDSFFKMETEGVFYWAGFIAADGCSFIKKNIYSQSKQLIINLSSKDYDHLVSFKNLIQAESEVKKYSVYSKKYKNINEMCRLDISSTEIFDDLNNIFMINERKTHTCLFPDNLKNHKLISHFMRGYFDGDGCIRSTKKDQGNIDICGTKEFLTSFDNILKLNGINSKSKINFHNGQYRIMYGGNPSCIKIAEYLYKDATIYLDRKYKRFLYMKDYKLRQNIKRDLKTKELKEKLINLYAKYENNDICKTKLVAKELGRTDTNVYFLLKQLGIKYLLGA